MASLSTPYSTVFFKGLPPEHSTVLIESNEAEALIALLKRDVRQLVEPEKPKRHEPPQEDEEYRSDSRPSGSGSWMK